MPTGADTAAFETWLDAMSVLAACDNVTVKISGLGMMFHNWTEEMIAPFVRKTITLFGPERCMFASNFPVDGMFSSFDRLWTAYANIVTDMSASDKDRLFRQTAEHIYRI
jgi:predicted TIM-barrel fold metal-dependent hydrolase